MKPSIQTTILRRTKIQRPEEFGKRQSPKFRRLKQRTIILTLLVLVCIVVYWLQTRPQTPVKAATKTTNAPEKIDASSVLSHRDNLTTEDLIYVASTMDNDPDAPLPVIMEHYKNRLEIADQLLAKSNDELAQKEGTLYRIEALQNLSKLNRTHQMGYSTLDQQLYELCAANLSHIDPEISKISAAAIMVTSFDEFTYEPTSANMKNAISKCNQVASQLNQDDEIARAIYTYARFKKKSDITVDDSVEFFKVVMDHYLKSSNAEARTTAEKAYREITFGDHSGEPKFANLLIAGIRDRFRQQRRSAESELTNRIRYSLNKKLFDEKSLLQVMNFLEILATTDRIDSAVSLAEEVRTFTSDLNENLSQEADQKIADLRTRLSQFNQPFRLDGLTPINDSETEWFKPRKSLLVYWTASNVRSQKLLKALNSLSVDQVLQCVVICPDTDEQAIQMAAKLDKEMPGFKFVRAADEESKFLKRFPVPQLPFMLLLNEAQEIVGINPDFRDLGKRIESLLK